MYPGRYSSSQQTVAGKLGLHTGSRYAVEQKTCVESHLGWRRPVAVGWIWQWTLCERASLSGAAEKRYGQALCNHYSTTARPSETQSNGIPSSPWAPASGLLVSEVTKEVRGTGDEGAGGWAREARNGFPEEDMIELWTMHCSMYRGELVRSGVCSAEL